MNAKPLLRWRQACAACTAFVLALPSLALACGACDEDSIAATYDHRVVQQAVAAHDLVVYCRLGGPVERSRLVAAARRVPGVRPDSIRTSNEPAALSFSVDPARQSARGAVASTLRGLPPGSRLTILKVVTNG